MTWDGIVTKYHKSHLKRLEIPMNVEAYIQYIVLKKTVETISFDRRRGLESGLNAEESWERASMGVIMRSEMHEEPIPPLKEAKREEDGVKILKPKNNTPLISQGGTTLEEPTNNINEESDLEEETIVVKELDLIYKCSVEIIPYVKSPHLSLNVEAFIHIIVLKKTFETIFYDQGRRLKEPTINIKKEFCKRLFKSGNDFYLNFNKIT
ncbi:hypothetical protein CWI38_1451p0010 [Hamiltosporidium tvaerminnensis]|uniref:Uncharacterized protein n=1 Tax=Hamiltosporidium tvaerminnensis TaxID=1176355 RepID=A0A4Q9LTP8_9MICR|nr:hypothetical protein CWI38_1451p0010 [Hamiltosporidium tvaerminnensis]